MKTILCLTGDQTLPWSLDGPKNTLLLCQLHFYKEKRKRFVKMYDILALMVAKNTLKYVLLFLCFHLTTIRIVNSHCFEVLIHHKMVTVIIF